MESLFFFLEPQPQMSPFMPKILNIKKKSTKIILNKQIIIQHWGVNPFRYYNTMRGKQ
jgi:hypothetical protein